MSVACLTDRRLTHPGPIAELTAFSDLEGEGTLGATPSAPVMKASGNG